MKDLARSCGLTMRQEGESVRAHIPWLGEGPCALTGGLSAITEICHHQPGNLTGRFIKMSHDSAAPSSDRHACAARGPRVVIRETTQSWTPIDPTLG